MTNWADEIKKINKDIQQAEEQKKAKESAQIEAARQCFNTVVKPSIEKLMADLSADAEVKESVEIMQGSGNFLRFRIQRPDEDYRYEVMIDDDVVQMKYLGGRHGTPVALGLPTEIGPMAKVSEEDINHAVLTDYKKRLMG